MRVRLLLAFVAVVLLLASGLLAAGTVESTLHALDGTWRTPVRVATLAAVLAVSVGVPVLARRAWRRPRPTSTFPMGRVVAAALGAALVAAFVFVVPPGPAAALHAEASWLLAVTAPAGTPADAGNGLHRGVETLSPPPTSAASSGRALALAPSALPPRQRGERSGALPRNAGLFVKRNVAGAADLPALRAIESDVPLVWMTEVPPPPDAALGPKSGGRLIEPASDGTIILEAAAPSNLVGMIDAGTGAWSGWRPAPAATALSVYMTIAAPGGLLTLPLRIDEGAFFPDRDFVAYDVVKGAPRFQAVCKGPGAQRTRPGVATSEHLYVGCGEEIVALDAQDGHERWRHRLTHAPPAREVEAYGTDVLAVLPEKNIVVATIRGRVRKLPFEVGVFYGLDATTGQERWSFRSDKMWTPDGTCASVWVAATPWSPWVLGARLRLLERHDDGRSWLQSFDVLTGALVWERRDAPRCARLGIDTIYETTETKSPEGRDVWSVQATNSNGEALGAPTVFAELLATAVADDGNLWALDKTDVTHESYLTHLVRLAPDGTMKRWVIGGDPVTILDVQGEMLTTRDAYAVPDLGPVLTRWRLPP